MGGMMGGGGKGGGGGGGMGGKGGSSGTTGADSFFAQQALGQNEQAIHNRYQQLGIGVPSGGTAAGAASSGGSLTYGSPSTMEKQDIGTLPTESGGAIGAADALMGQLYNPQQAAGLGPGGTLQQLAQQNQQQEASGFAAGSGGGFGNAPNATF
jgi:hypothetical protein